MRPRMGTAFALCPSHLPCITPAHNRSACQLIAPRLPLVARRQYAHIFFMQAESSSTSNTSSEETSDQQQPNHTTSAAATEPAADEPQLDDSDSGSSSGGSGNGHDGSDDSDHEGNDDDKGSDSSSSPLAGVREQIDNNKVLAQVREVVEIPTSKVSSAASSVYEFFASRIAAVLRVVPAPVIVALISLVSTVSGARYKVKRDREAAKEAERKAAKKKKEQIENNLRKSYADLAAPILKSAAKLAERLHILVDLEWDRVEKSEVDSMASPAYSAYLLGRYLATVEIIKQESALLDYGFPAADRILANILGRVQGVLCANDDVLMEMQRNEHLFSPPSGHKPLRGGRLRVTPRAQTVLGELLLRKLYTGKVSFVDRAENEKRGPRAVISFLEFSRLLEEDATVARWYKPIIKEFMTLENVVRHIPRNKRRCDAIGARLYFLQSGLLDLVEFFDPLPHAQAIPFYRRRRLQLGGLSYSEEQRAPSSLHLLYNELANIRDHRVMGGSRMARLRLPNGGVEVHVKAMRLEKLHDMPSTKHGDCPYSHRVLIVLEELGVPYKMVAIPANAKPAWFYLLHPEKRTPVVYHDGNLIEDSKHIVSYLLEQFKPSPGKLPLASAAKLQLAVGTAAFTRFHSHFLDWVSGKEAAKDAVERELRKLNCTVERAQGLNETGPFLGGDRFAREDTAIAPMLNNVAVAGRALKNWDIPEDCPALRKYLSEARKVPSFAKTVGDEDSIISGYCNLAKAGGEKVWALADMLE